MTSDQWPVFFFKKNNTICIVQRVTCGLDLFSYLQFSILNIINSKHKHDLFHFINFEVTYFQIVALNWFSFYLFFLFIHFSFSLSHFFFCSLNVNFWTGYTTKKRTEFLNAPFPVISTLKNHKPEIISDRKLSGTCSNLIIDRMHAEINYKIFGWNRFWKTFFFAI